jgi:hypothetical protein
MPATVIAERIGWDRDLLFAVGEANPAQHQVSGVGAVSGALADGAGRG